MQLDFEAEIQQEPNTQRYTPIRICGVRSRWILCQEAVTDREENRIL